MYIRDKPRTLKSGKQANTFTLVESYRVNGRPKQRTLLNLGHDFHIPKSQWRILTRLIEDQLRGYARLPVDDDALIQASHNIVQRLRDKGYDIHDPRDDRDAILTYEIDHTDTRTVGGERVALKALRLLGFSQLLRTLGLNENQIRGATALVVGRMLSPGSELQTHQWMRERSSILELLCAELPSERVLYDIGDLLYDRREALMAGLFGNTKELLGFDETIVFYDLTNTFYTGRQRGTLLKYGRSKQKRSDCPLVTLAVVLDGSGFPRTANILPGNASEPHTLKQAIAQLNGDKPTVIMDAGIATAANLAYLKEQGLDWICVQRTKTPVVPDRKPDEVFQTTTQTQVRAWALGVQDQVQKVYLHSAARQAVSDQILHKKRTEFEAALAYLNEGLGVKGRPKKQAVIERKVGRLTEKFKTVSYQYEVKVIQKKGSPNAERIRIQQRAAFDECTDALGGYVLQTSHTEWRCEKVARTYWRLADIEQTFRTMKSDLGLRPIYHRKNERIEAHLFLSILAFHVAHLIRCKLRTHHIYSSWGTLKVNLNHQHRVTTVLPQNKTHCILLKQDAKLKPFQREIFQAMGLKMGKYAQRIKAKRSPEEDTVA